MIPWVDPCFITEFLCFFAKRVRFSSVFFEWTRFITPESLFQRNLGLWRVCCSLWISNSCFLVARVQKVWILMESFAD